MALPSGNYISLFAGAGGLDLGLRIACPSTKCVGYVEISAEAAQLLAARIEDGSLDPAPIWSDVRSYDGHRRRGQVDGLIGGFPCQDVSVAGKRAGLSGKRSGLWGEYERLIEEIQPSWVCIENVGGLLSSLTLLHRPEILGYFDQILSTAESPKERWYAQHHIDRLERRLLPVYGISALLYVQCCLGALGYKSEAGLFTAAEVGASHDRLRVFILAYRPSGGLRILRQSSGSHGLTDRSQPELVYTNVPVSEARGSVTGRAEKECYPRSGSELAYAIDGGSQDRRPESRRSIRNSGDEDFGPAATEPGGSSAEQAGQLADPARDERDGSHGQAGAGRGIRETGDDLGRPVADGERSRRPGSAREELPGDRSALQAARPGDEDGELADTEVIGRHCGWEREERAGGEGRDQSIGGGELLADSPHERRERWQGGRSSVGVDVPPSGQGRAGDDAVRTVERCDRDSLADAGDGLVPESWGRPEGRDGAGPAVPVLADTTDHHRRRGVCSAETGTGEDGVGWRGSAVSQPDLGHTDLQGLEGRSVTGPEGGEGRQRPGEPASAELSLFAPGPGARDLWQKILGEYPWLTPAISTEEIESVICRTPSGTSFGVDLEGRTDRLRALGNLVCPIQAAAAITVLMRRLS